MATIGIAFGNSSTSFATIKDGKVDVIANPDGERFIASALSYVDGDEYHGQQALAQIIRSPRSTLVNFRDFIGQPFSSIDASNTTHGATPIDVDGKIGFYINGNNITIDEVVKRHLKQIKNAAEDYLGQAVEGVVLTVPTNFTEAQKEALTKIAAEAGLKVLQLINEPSAALLAHLSQKDQLAEDKIYVVADFGGIRSDAAVVAVRGGILTLLSTEHSTTLGGAKLDSKLIDFVADDFQKKFKADAKKTEKSVAKLTESVVITKKTLSNVPTSTISVDSLSEGYDYMSSINRLRFEVIARDVFSEMVTFVESAVEKAGLTPLDIDSVLLVGGSSNIPKVASNMQFVFPETTEIIAPSIDSKLPNPNELNCRGAAIQASLVQGFDAEEIAESLTPVVINTPHLAKPIGVKDAEGKFVTLISRETAYPIKKTVSFQSASANVLIELYEGERSIKETVIEPEVYSDADEDDSEEEPEIIKELEYVPGSLLGKIDLASVGSGKTVEVILNITKDGKLNFAARAGDISAKVVIEQQN